MLMSPHISEYMAKAKTGKEWQNGRNPVNSDVLQSLPVYM